MWPFKRKPTITAEEYATARPPAPCGDQKEHVFWTELQGMMCPVCVANERRAQKERDENRLAEKIAAAVVRQMAARDGESLEIKQQRDELLAALKGAEEWLSDWASAEPYLTVIRSAIATADGNTRRDEP